MKNFLQLTIFLVCFSLFSNAQKILTLDDIAGQRKDKFECAGYTGCFNYDGKLSSPGLVECEVSSSHVVPDERERDCHVKVVPNEYVECKGYVDISDDLEEYSEEPVYQWKEVKYRCNN